MYCNKYLKQYANKTLFYPVTKSAYRLIHQGKVFNIYNKKNI
ncbi:hypothetical protein LDG_5798 [Legionella drancourtii LLAP12]|uniref:Uncharacterized protein n=1 Tax=Legionella drancourtii LLAP12 TaxID=658187 RepID=G9EKQ9_9GAMM|nr:hypothetical protein LDG_5798 [Legionella drancourtii LLAP12]